VTTIVITGASSGIGAIAAERLAERGWGVAVVGRNAKRTRAVAAAVGGTPFIADYDRLDDVRALAAELLARYPRIDVLANNAGGLVGHHGVSADGHERTIQHNHLAPFLLTNLLLPRLEASQARVINTASLMNRFGVVRPDNLNRQRLPYLGGAAAYSAAKLATVLFTKELARRSSVSAYSFHPGFVATSFGHDSAIGRMVLGAMASRQISADQGAQPLIQLASGPDLAAASGTYFDGLYPDGATGRGADSVELAGRLWAASATLVGLSDS
jgi:NAD(P)-dependent dehydrogenase (short-subunit alcohol dehydrogenase family)